MKKIVAVILTVFAIATNAQAKEVIRVGYLPILDHAALVVSHAHDNNQFSHIDVQLREFKSWSAISGALKSDLIDAAFILSPLGMSLFNEGVDIKSILLAHRDGSAITVKVGSNIKSALDLKGKIIAIPDKQSTHLALLGKYLRSGGVALSDVQTPVIAPPFMESAMQKGAIDAFIVAEPFGAKAQSNGVGNILVLTNQIIPNHVECIVVVKQRYINSNPNGIQEWVDSLIKAGKFIDKDKLSNGSKSVSAIIATPTYMGHAENLTQNGLQMPANRISYSNLKPDIAGFQEIVQISKDAKILNDVNLNGFINSTFYEKSPEK